MTPTPATVTWFELGTADLEATTRFYRELFGWTNEPDTQPGYHIVTAGLEGLPKGGFAEITGDQTPYAIFAVQVPDVAATCAKAEELGAKIIAGPVVDPASVSFAHLLDAEGRHIGVWCPPAAT